jgi:hypothetical protein
LDVHYLSSPLEKPLIDRKLSSEVVPLKAVEQRAREFHRHFHPHVEERAILFLDIKLELHSAMDDAVVVQEEELIPFLLPIVIMMIETSDVVMESVDFTGERVLHTNPLSETVLLSALEFLDR